MKHTSNYRNLLIGDGFSAFGSWIDFLAILTMAAYQYKVNAFEMGAVSAAALLPGILLARRIGRLCDSQNPRTILQWSIVGRLAMTCAIIFSGDYYAFLALICLRSIFTSVAPSAINVLAVRSIDESSQPRFYAALNILNNAAKVVAPSIGTVASSISGESFALMLSAACSMGALVFFSQLSVSPMPEVSLAASNGTDVPAVAPKFTAFIFVTAIYAFFVFMVNNLVPLALQQSGFDKSLLGLLISCSGAGNILSGLWLAKRASAVDAHVSLTKLTLPAALQAVGFLCIGLILAELESASHILLPLGFFVIGTFSARYAITCNIFMTKHYSSNIGAASSTLQGWQNAMILIAPVVGAVILEHTGPSTLFISAAVIGLTAYATFWLSTQFTKTQLSGG
jgi:MFS transporter, DHA1 family, staphyloferrin B biosynthesis exporter